MNRSRTGCRRAKVRVCTIAGFKGSIEPLRQLKAAGTVSLWKTLALQVFTFL